MRRFFVFLLPLFGSLGLLTSGACSPPGLSSELIILQGDGASSDSLPSEPSAEPPSEASLPPDGSELAPEPPLESPSRPETLLEPPSLDGSNERPPLPDPGAPDPSHEAGPETEVAFDAASEAPPEAVLPEKPKTEAKPETSTTETTRPDDRQYIGLSCQAGSRSGTCQFTTDCKALPDKEPLPGFCPGTSAVQCCVPKPPSTSTCDPAAKPTPHAGMTEAPGSPGCPSGMRRVSTFCIDQYEAALLEILPSGITQPWSPFFNPGTRRIKAVSIRGAVPQGYINGRQAASACQEAGKRLCTDTEWLRACQGPSQTTYPYGNTRQAGVCNDARAVHPAVEYFGTSDPSVFSKIQHQCINQIPASLLPTGAKASCVTVEGIHDMMGNLHEWTADPAGTFRGGYYVDTYRNGNGCLYRTTAHDTGHWDYSTGFRCCATPTTP